MELITIKKHILLEADGRKGENGRKREKGRKTKKNGQTRFWMLYRQRKSG